MIKDNAENECLDSEYLIRILNLTSKFKIIVWEDRIFGHKALFLIENTTCNYTRVI